MKVRYFRHDIGVSLDDLLPVLLELHLVIFERFKALFNCLFTQQLLDCTLLSLQFQFIFSSESEHFVNWGFKTFIIVGTI